jgi:hypothetical protein
MVSLLIHSYKDTAYAVESVVSKLSQTLGLEFRLKIRSMLENKASRLNISKNGVEGCEILRILVFFKQTKTTTPWCWINLNTRISEHFVRVRGL